MTDLNVCIRFCFKLGKFYAEFLSAGSSFWRADSGRNTSFGEQTVGGTQVLESGQWEEYKFWRADSGRNTSFGERTVGGTQVLESRQWKEHKF